MPTIQIADTELYYESKGNGPCILFAHGAGGNAAIWFNQIAHFSEAFQCITFDHRSFGRTRWDGTEITVERFRDDVIALLDELNCETAHMVGQSMGGLTVLRCALDIPERVSSLTLSCSSGGIINPTPSDSLEALTTVEGDDTAVIKNTMSRQTVENRALNQLYESINNFNTEFSWDKLGALLDMKEIELAELAGVTAPTLFIAGAEDPMFPPEQLRAYVPHFPKADIEVVENAGHSPYFEQPRIFNKLLENHVK